MGVTPRQSVTALAVTTLAIPEPTGAALNLRFIVSLADMWCYCGCAFSKHYLLPGP
jgi:hypothetical protein